MNTNRNKTVTTTTTTTTTTENMEERNMNMNTMNNTELELILQDEWSDYTVSKNWFEPDEYAKLKELADMIGSDKVVIFGYDSIYDSAEMPNEIFWIGEFYVYGKMFESYTWYIAPIKWRWTPGDNVWMHMSASDTVKLYPFCLQENAWPVIYSMDEDLRHDRDGLHHIGVDVGNWGVYEDKDGNFVLMN